MEESKVSHAYITTMHRDSLRAPEANEMLERTPDKLLRMGPYGVAIMFGVMLFVAIFVKYPDTLEGAAIITTNPLPIKLKSVSGGRITRLFVADNTVAQQNAVIAEIENPTGYENIMRLNSTVDTINQYLQNNNNAGLQSMIESPLQSLGDVQVFYNQMLQQISAKLLLQKEDLYKKRTQNLQEHIGKLANISEISMEEKKMIEEELKQSSERFAANEKLYKDKVISRQEYYDEATRLRQKQLQLEQQKRNIIQNNLSSGDDSKQMLDMQYEQQEKSRLFNVGIEEAIRNISNYIQTWKQHYLVVAPYTGLVHYLRPLQVNEPTLAGEDIFAIVPSEHKYMALVMVAAAGIGKIDTGQKVHLLLDNFPYNEFGFLEGTIISRSTMPEPVRGSTGTQAMYRVSVKMRDTLITNYHKDIPFSPEMTATGRIITKDRNLLQRLIASIAKTDK